jgi:hypothetical protein
MATVNLGSIKFNWQGAYAGGTAYAVDDVVSYNGSSYICKLASTGNLPTNTTYWDQMSSAGTDGTDLTTTLTTQGDILYRDGSGLARLPAGTAGEALITNGTGANPSWGSVGGGLLQIKRAIYSTQGASFNSTSGYSATPLAVTITPTASDSSFWINAVMRYSYRDNHDTTVKFNVSDSQVGSTTALFSEVSHTGTGVGNVFFGYGSYAADGAVDDYWLEQGLISGMYTPASNNGSARTFSIIARNSSIGQIKWNETQTTGNVQSSGAVSWIEVWEIANGIYS